MNGNTVVAYWKLFSSFKHIYLFFYFLRFLREKRRRKQLLALRRELNMLFLELKYC